MPVGKMIRLKLVLPWSIHRKTRNDSLLYKLLCIHFRSIFYRTINFIEATTLTYNRQALILWLLSPLPTNSPTSEQTVEDDLSSDSLQRVKWCQSEILNLNQKLSRRRLNDINWLSHPFGKNIKFAMTLSRQHLKITYRNNWEMYEFRDDKCRGSRMLHGCSCTVYVKIKSFQTTLWWSN